MNVDKNSRVLRTIGARELDGRRIGVAGSRNAYLVACRIELGTAGRTRDMEGNNFGANEVVARGKVRRYFECPVTAVHIQHLDCPVVRIVRNKTSLGNLEPTGARSGRRASIRYFGHVDRHWSIMLPSDGFVCARALSGLRVHLHREGITSLDWAYSVTRSSSITRNVGARDTGDRRVAERSTDTRRSSIHAPNPELLEG